MAKAGNWAAAILLAMPGAAYALPKPMTLAPVFANEVVSEIKLARNFKACRIHVLSLTDSRRSPEMIGVYERRPIFAPQDRVKWIKSIIQALNTRGLAVSFQEDGTAPSDIATATFDLSTAWITNTQVNISASAVFQVQAAGANSRIDRFYRGGNSRMTYWSNGASVLQSAIDTAFARALDAMATDLVKLCDGPKPSA